MRHHNDGLMEVLVQTLEDLEHVGGGLAVGVRRDELQA